MVFFTTARLTGMYAELFDKMGMPVLELHSRKSQPQRWEARLPVSREYTSIDTTYYILHTTIIVYHTLHGINPIVLCVLYY